MTLTQILQKIKSVFYTKAEADTLLNEKAKASDLTTHTSDTNIHVTTSDKAKWNGKQDALSSQQIQNIADVTNKANDSDVVHKSGNETISGVKTFASNMIIHGGKKVVCDADNSYIELNGGTTWGKGGSIVLSGQDRLNYTNSVIIATKNDTDNFHVQYQNGYLKPIQGNNSLGTSTYKWKTLNGINPGALSLPEPSTTMIEKSFPSSGGKIIADVDGWFELRAIATSPSAYIQIYVAGGSSVYAKNTRDNLMISVPMRAGSGATIFYRDLETPSICRLVPCKGNV